MRGVQGTPAQTGKEGLFRLVEQAYVSYKEEVATRQKSYRRYVLDFIHSKRFHDATDAWSKNEHQKNYHTVIELLRKHERLVRKHFDHDILDENGISTLLNEFYAIDLPGTALESGCGDSGNTMQNGQESNIVTSNNNTKLVLLLDKLASHDVITYNWQSVIAKKRLIISSSGKKHLNQHDMSSTLNRIKDTAPNIAEKQFLAIIDKYITLIKNREV